MLDIISVRPLTKKKMFSIKTIPFVHESSYYRHILAITKENSFNKKKCNRLIEKKTGKTVKKVLLKKFHFPQQLLKIFINNIII